MLIQRLISPDYPLGKLLMVGRMFLDLSWFLLCHPTRRSFRIASLIWRVKPEYTMVTNSNLVNHYGLITEVDRLGLPGDIVECGVWNGGASALMGAAHEAASPGKPPISRSFWLFDSFSGMPEPSSKDGKAAQSAYFEGYCLGKIENVEAVIRKLRLPREPYRIIRGWFEDTLPASPIEKIALLHADADWYDSVKTVLGAFYDSVVSGGYVVFDDYGYWDGCRKAVDEFVAERQIPPANLHRVSQTGLYIVKP